MHYTSLICADKKVSLDRPRVMGILNATPDSFSDGGRWIDREKALRHALRMVSAGADMIDVGGESTRPGSVPVGAQEEIDRVVPLIQSLASEIDKPVSIDTSKPEVMHAAVRAGAGMINDVLALRQDGALEMAASLHVPVCLMHMQGLPRDMQHQPEYGDVVKEVGDFLLERAHACEGAGIPHRQILLDPGFGFGKSLEHNLELFRALPELAQSGYPLLVGVSRKSMLGQLTGHPVGERLVASIIAALLAVQAGASIVRVHDVAETIDALSVACALLPLRD
jgi:dihydropteroate synthase